MEGKVELQASEITSAFTTTMVVVGALVNGKPNFMAVSWCTPASIMPPCVAICCAKVHMTNRGIRASRAFSLSVPSRDLVAKTDYCGIKSGVEVDKSDIWRTAPGPATGAPLLYDCSVTCECSLSKSFDIGTHELFIGKVEHLYASPLACEGHGVSKLDVARMFPCLFSFSGPGYYDLGQRFAIPWSVGLSYEHQLQHLQQQQQQLQQLQQLQQRPAAAAQASALSSRSGTPGAGEAPQGKEERGPTPPPEKRQRVATAMPADAHAYASRAGSPSSSTASPTPTATPKQAGL
eukprot:m51a1_g14495 hypothetical protein (292) ;mRNA; f:767228-768476